MEMLALIIEAVISNSHCKKIKEVEQRSVWQTVTMLNKTVLSNMCFHNPSLNILLYSVPHRY